MAGFSVAINTRCFYICILNKQSFTSHLTKVKSDSNTLLFLGNGYVVIFGYEKECIKYFSDAVKMEIPTKDKQFIANGYGL